MDASELWAKGSSLLDVGSGPGWLSAYLAAKYGMRVMAFDTPGTAECEAFMLSPFGVNFFVGRLPVAPLAVDAVSFMNVLHHAAEMTASLLEQAAAIARRFIIVIEDLDLGWNRVNLERHDGDGNFRNASEWQGMFATHLPGFVLSRTGRLRPKQYSSGLVVRVGKFSRASEHLTYYLLERAQPMPQPTHHVVSGRVDAPASTG